MNLTDTIVAAATGEVQSALGMIRMSGRQATDIISKVFIPLDNKDFKTSAKANRLYYGRIVTAERMVAEKNGTPADSDGIIDECMVSVFKAPHSFTGEDTVEISHHGSLYIRRKILQLLIDNGARTAQRGEFSMRAFLNGKMNLSQTEAVADLINSENSSSHDLALKQLRGSYNEELKLLRQKFLKTASLLELEIDFSAEQEVFIDRKELEENLRSCIQRIESLLKSFKQGNAFKNGIPVAIVGKPNSGKSTLMNALLNDNRSIVSSTEGTTRDTIEEAINVNGIKVRFIDTAGLRNSDNEIEREGIKRSLEAVKKAQTVLYLADASRDDCESIEYQLAFLKQDVDLTGKRLILIVNKDDISNINSQDRKRLEQKDAIFISAAKKKGTDKILKAVTEDYNGEDIAGKVFVTNIRHYECLKKSLDALMIAEQNAQAGMSADIIAYDIRTATDFFGQITGEITNEEVLGSIFSNFCIGK